MAPSSVNIFTQGCVQDYFFNRHNDFLESSLVATSQFWQGAPSSQCAWPRNSLAHISSLYMLISQYLCRNQDLFLWGFNYVVYDSLKNWSCRFWKCSAEQLAAAFTASSFLSSKCPISFSSSSLSLLISLSYAAICKKAQQFVNLSAQLVQSVQVQLCNEFICQWNWSRL